MSAQKTAVTIIVVVMAIVCLIAGGIFAAIKKEQNYSEYVENTNEEVMAIMDGYVPEIKEFFYRNKEAFVKEIGKDTLSTTTVIDNEKFFICMSDTVVDSTTIKNAVIFTMDSTIGTKDACFYEISIIYFEYGPIEKASDNTSFVKLDDNWYIRKDFFWGV